MSFTAAIFLVVYIAGLSLALFRNPIYGLLAYLWTFYLFPPYQWWAAEVPELRWSLWAALITFAATLYHNRQDIGAWLKNWGVRILIAFAVWLWVQSSWAVNSSEHFKGCILFTKYVALFYVINVNIRDYNSLFLFAGGHVAGCFILGWIARGVRLVDGRLEGVGGPGISDANTLGMHLTTGLVFAGFLFLGVRNIWKWAAFVAIPFILNGIILTGSRGAMLAMAGAGIMGVIMAPKSYRNKIFGAFALGAILLGYLANDTFWQRLSLIQADKKTGKYEASAQSRFDLLNYGFEMFNDHPMGVGHGGHIAISRNYIPNLRPGEKKAAHNTFMAVLVNHGFVGLIIFSALLCWVVWLARNSLRFFKIGVNQRYEIFFLMVLASMVAWITGGQFSNYLKAEVFIWLIAMLTSLSGIIKKDAVTFIVSLNDTTTEQGRRT